LSSMISTRLSHLRDDDGQALVEYALIIMLVALVTVGGLTAIGVSVNNILNQLAGAF
jgi:pilus assembly protein Flp/PilA